MTSLAKYAILATIQKGLRLALWHRADSGGGGMQTKQVPREQRKETDLPASSGVRIFAEAIAVLSMKVVMGPPLRDG